jgi:hypothetical protein
MSFTLTEQARDLLDKIGQIQVEQMGQPEEWDKAGRDIYDAAQTMYEIVEIMDVNHRLRRLEDAVREINPGLNI